MNQFDSLLDKFRKLLTSSESVKKDVIASINAKTRLELVDKDVDIRDGIAYLKSHPLTKNEVFMRKNLILQELKTKLGDKAPRDIR